MRKVYVKRVFSVLMILVLLVGVVTFPSDAQEAAYTQLQQRENVTLKRLAGIPAEEAKIALSNAGFDTSDITDDMLSLFLKELQNGYSSDFSFDDRESYEPKEARHYTALLLYGRQIQRFFYRTRSASCGDVSMGRWGCYTVFCPRAMPDAGYGMFGGSAILWP